MPTLSTVARNAACDAVVDLVDGGTTNAQGTLEILDSGDVSLVEFDLSNPSFGDAATGVATMAGVTLTATADATGTAAKWKLKDRDGTTVLNGTVRATGDADGGEEMVLGSTSITATESVSIDLGLVTQPAS